MTLTSPPALPPAPTPVPPLPPQPVTPQAAMAVIPTTVTARHNVPLALLYELRCGRFSEHTVPQLGVLAR